MDAKLHRPKLRLGMKNLVLIFIGTIIASIGLQLFLVPNKVIDGGVVGISIMLNTLTGLPFGVFMVGVNLPFVLLGAKHIGKSFAVRTIIAVILLSLWSEFFAQFPKVTDDIFLGAIFGGIIDGIGVGLIIKGGGSLDGTEIMGIIGSKRTPFSVGDLVMFMNLFILGAAGLLYGWDSSMYSLVAYFVIAKMMDTVVTGFDESYSVMIVTNNYRDVSGGIMHEMHRGVTLLHGKGAWTGEDKWVLYVVVNRLELQQLKDLVLELDPQAFLTSGSVKDLVGGQVKGNDREH